jgi:hypothetical protein
MACHFLRQPGGAGFILCGTREKVKHRCFYCEAPASYQCDHPVFRRNRKATCDTWICEQCVKTTGNMDLCKSHFEQWTKNGNRLTA